MADYENSAHLTSGTPGFIEGQRLLAEPLKQITDSGIAEIYALDVTDEAAPSPLAYVLQEETHMQWLGEFSDEPTGEYSPITLVAAVIGDEDLYHKKVRKDLPFSGMRTAIARQKATRKLKGRLGL